MIFLPGLQFNYRFSLSKAIPCTPFISAIFPANELSIRLITSTSVPCETKDTAAQYKWLEHLLSTTNAKWKLVFGHHHFYTAEGQSEELNDLRDRFGSLFEKYKVDFYICGHQHSLQYMQHENYTKFIISGAGSETEKVYRGIAEFASSSSGFTAISLNDNSISIEMIDYKGNILFNKFLKHEP